MTVIQGPAITVQDELHVGVPRRAAHQLSSTEFIAPKVVGNAGECQFTGAVSSVSCTEGAGEGVTSGWREKAWREHYGGQFKCLPVEVGEGRGRGEAIER